MIKKIFQPSVLIFFAAILAALFFGLVSVGFVSMFGEKLTLVLALPAVVILGLMFVFDRYLLFMLILLVRPALDPILNQTKIGGVGVGGVMNALVILMALIAIIQKDFEFRPFLAKIWLPFLVILFIAVGIAPDRAHAVKTYLSLFSNAAMFTLAIALIRTQKDYGYWMRIVLFSSLIPVLYGFVDYAHGGTWSADAGNRVSSTFSHPNILAFYLTLMISLSFYFIKSKVAYIPNFVRKVLPVYILMMMALLVFTKTRSAWVACFAFFALYGLIFERKYLLLVIAAPFLGLLIPELHDRIVDLTKGNEVVTYGTLNSYAWRKYIWTSGLNFMSPSHYFFGYGLEGFLHYSIDFFPLSNGMETGAHSVYVQLIFDTGVIGLLTYLWLNAGVALYLAPFYKANKLMIFSAVMLIGQYALIAYSDNMLSYLAFNWYFWFVLGATYSIVYHDKKRLDSENKPPA